MRVHLQTRMLLHGSAKLPSQGNLMFRTMDFPWKQPSVFWALKKKRAKFVRVAVEQPDRRFRKLVFEHFPVLDLFGRDHDKELRTRTVF